MKNIEVIKKIISTEGRVLVAESEISATKTQLIKRRDYNGGLEVDIEPNVIDRINDAETNLNKLSNDFNKHITNHPSGGSPENPPSINKSIYYVVLEEWGIHDGFLEEREYTFNEDGSPIPKYTKEEWEIAYDNKNGLDNVLKYAKENNYGTVVLPKCNIFICYEEKQSNVNIYHQYKRYPIVIPSGVTLDMNNSTIKVIYDSHVANPYDLSQHTDANPVYKLPGCIFTFSQAYHSCIKNGTLIGDIYERAFDDNKSGFDSEKGCEFTTGIEINTGSSYCTIENMIIKGFMGDAISSMTDHDPDKGSALYNPEFKTQSVIESNGNEREEKGSYSTDYLDISTWTTKEGIMRTNIGYSRVPNFKNMNFLLSYYDINKTFTSQQSERYLQNFLIPHNAKYLRVTIFHEQEDLALPFRRDFQITPKAGEYCTITKCEITENHRGGISNMVNHSIIEKCKIFNNGNGHFENFPEFPDSTKYAINCEDCLPLNLIVRDCYIYNHFNGILFAGNSVTVDNNIFKNMSSCLHLYNCESANFVLNKVYNSGSCVSNTSSSRYIRYVSVTNNKLFDSELIGGNDSSTKVRYFVENNSIRGVFSIKANKDIHLSNLIVDYQRKDNTYKVVEAILENASNVAFYMNDGFISSAKFYLTTEKSCKNISVMSDENLKNKTPIASKKLNGTSLSNVAIRTIPYSTTINNNDTTEFDADNCEFINTSILGGEYYNNIDQYIKANISNSNITMIKKENGKTVPNFISSVYYENAYTRYHSYSIKNCIINIDSDVCQNIITLENGKIEGKITFENCEIINTGSNINLNLVNLSSHIDGSKLNLNIKNCTLKGLITKSNNSTIVINEENVTVIE